jgi:hypothetical protein
MDVAGVFYDAFNHSALGKVCCALHIGLALLLHYIYRGLAAFVSKFGKAAKFRGALRKQLCSSICSQQTTIHTRNENAPE